MKSGITDPEEIQKLTKIHLLTVYDIISRINLGKLPQDSPELEPKIPLPLCLAVKVQKNKIRRVPSTIICRFSKNYSLLNKFKTKICQFTSLNPPILAPYPRTLRVKRS